MLALDGSRCAWFIEAKDYRRHRRTKTINEVLTNSEPLRVVTGDRGQVRLIDIYQ